MALTPKDIAKMLDHSTLQPWLTEDDIRHGCEVALKYDTASVCARPCDVPILNEMLKGSGVKVCTVIGFPHGTHATAAKVAESRIALEDGADELDMVVNVSKAKDGDWDYVRRDIAAVLDVAHAAGKLLKVIFECCFLTDEEKIRLCEICTELGVDFVKTSTGYGTGGATVADIALMKAHVGPGVRIKAAGGIHDLAQLLALREAGATRFGCSRTAALLAAT